VSESDKSDELEYASLQSSISSAERVLRSSGGTDILLRNFLENAKVRVSLIEKKLREAREQDSRAKEEVTAYLARNEEIERETALNDNEKRTYDSFLREDFFTKKDFGRLDKFYSETWDRLTESGKTEMSHRLWEGVRRDEYTFTGLPKSVREKETKQAYKLLRDLSNGPQSALQIPEKDRSDFIRAYERGNQEEASRILDRESFKKNMFKETASRTIKHVSAELGRDADAANVEKRFSGTTSGPNKQETARKSGTTTDLDISGINLDGLKMAEAPAQISAADIPTDKTPVVKNGPSLGSG
jgi:hypothetical protein